MTNADIGATLAVIPAYNEANTIALVVAEVTSHGFACVVVDDASTDETAELAAGSGAALVRLPLNLGVGGALKVGFRYAVEHGYRQVVQVDGDGQHVCGEIERLIDAARRTDADMVVGSRFYANDRRYDISALRRVCIRLLARRVQAAGLTISDPTSGFRLIREPLLGQYAARFPAHYLGDTFEALVVAGKRGYTVVDVGVAMRPRQGGRPSADMKTLARSMVRSMAVAVTGPSFDIAPKAAR